MSPWGSVFTEAFFLSSFKFCHWLYCGWRNCEVCLQTWIHRSTVWEVGFSLPHVPSAHVPPFPKSAGGVCWTGWFGAGIPLRARRILGKIQDCSLNKSLASFSLLLFFRSLRMRCTPHTSTHTHRLVFFQYMPLCTPGPSSSLQALPHLYTSLLLPAHP